MKIFYSIKDFIDHKLEINVFIPTMGNLHNGHMSLVEQAKKYSDNICVSVYINEDQFTEKKDFEFRTKKLSGEGIILTKKPIIADDDELEVNRRARSAKLRILKKI